MGFVISKTAPLKQKSVIITFFKGGSYPARMRNTSFQLDDKALSVLDWMVVTRGVSKAKALRLCVERMLQQEDDGGTLEPRKTGENLTQTVLAPETWDRLEMLVKRLGCSKSALVSAAVVDAEKDGGMFREEPKHKPPKEKVRRPAKRSVGATLDQHARAWLEDKVDKEGRTLTHWANEALRDFLSTEIEKEPWVEEYPETSPFTFYVERGLWDEAIQYAEFAGKSRSGVLRMAISAQMEKEVEA